MSFDTKDYHELVKLLEQHPEWKAELRRLLLSDSLLNMPDLLNEILDIQKATLQILKELVAAQARTEERLEKLEATVEQLAAAQARTEARLQELAAAQTRTEERVARIDGRTLESQYREKAASYFGKILKQVKVASVVSLLDEMGKEIPEEEFDELLNLDILVSGIPRRDKEPSPVWLAIEVSSVVDKYDVKRAVRRASILRNAGIDAIPVAAGEDATLGAEEAARQEKAILVQDGRILLWKEAFS